MYDGLWKNNMFNGKGTFTWKDCKYYIGDWKEDKKHGKGMMRYPDGRKY